MTQNVRIERPWGNGRIVWTRDATANDSNKAFTVPAGKVWVLKLVYILMATSADVGNRVLAVRITDGTNTLMEGYANHVMAASGSVMFYFYIGPGLGIASTAAGATGNSYQGLPGPITLPAGYVVNVLDASAIAAGADDMTVVLHYIEYDA